MVPNTKKPMANAAPAMRQALGESICADGLASSALITVYSSY
jgi:hypothetical protein